MISVNGTKLDSLLKAKLEANLPKAQYKLDTQVVNDMVPYMPMQTGTFINMVRMRNASMAGTGEIVAATGVMGRFLYEGNKMIDPVKMSGPRPITLDDGELIFRWRKGAKLLPTALPLTYNKSANPLAGAHWFERAKADRIEDWKKLVKESLINGR